jgi:hypothetical protein
MNSDAALLISLAVALTIAVALVASLLRILADDGYGRRPVPSSHRQDWGSSTLPSCPF